MMLPVIILGVLILALFVSIGYLAYCDIKTQKMNKNQQVNKK